MSIFIQLTNSYFLFIYTTFYIKYSHVLSSKALKKFFSKVYVYIDFVTLW